MDEELELLRPNMIASMALLNKRGFTGPVSLHTEYMVEKGAQGAPSPEFVKASLEAFKRDLAVVKDWMGWQ